MSDLIVNSDADLAKLQGATIEDTQFHTINALPTLCVRVEGKDGGTWELLIAPATQVSFNGADCHITQKLNLSTRRA
mgnify:CR=1 FL=1